MHNGKIPKEGYLEQWERDAILEYYKSHREEGCRRITYMLMDEDIVYVSPSTVYRVLKAAGVMRKWNVNDSKRGEGYRQPERAHEK